MIAPRWYFPWRAARAFFVAHLIVFLVALYIVVTSIRFDIHKEFAATNDVARSIGLVDGRLQSVALLATLIVVLTLIWTTRKYVKPLGRVIQRTRQLRKSDYKVGTSAELQEDIIAGDEAGEDEPGEWQDLERTVVRLHRDLRNRTVQMEREREELHALVGAVSDAILSVGNHEEVRFFNAQFGSLFGGSGQRQLSDMIRNPDILESFRSVLKDGKARSGVARVYTRLHTQARFFSVSVAATQKDGGAVDGAVGVFHDITELKAAEQIRIDFVANASHEMRTPLTSLKGYIETMSVDIKDKRYEQLGECIEVVSRSVSRMNELINDLLDLSKIESGAEMNSELISTHQVTESALKGLKPRADLKGHSLATTFKVDSLVGDSRWVEQVVVNLIDNAIKYVREKGKIEIIWEKQNDATILRIKDNGPGIAYEHQGRLFERFYRVDAGRSRDQGGTGLGLAIVKHIMLRHGGSVHLKSQPGDGAEFHCLFPDEALKE